MTLVRATSSLNLLSAAFLSFLSSLASICMYGATKGHITGDNKSHASCLMLFGLRLASRAI